MSCILQFLIYRNKIFWFRKSVTVVYDAVSLGILYSKFRDNLVVSYSRVDKIKNIPLN